MPIKSIPWYIYNNSSRIIGVFFFFSWEEGKKSPVGLVVDDWPKLCDYGSSFRIEFFAP